MNFCENPIVYFCNLEAENRELPGNHLRQTGMSTQEKNAKEIFKK